uniref:Putative capsid protein n=1 Tax=viral metagenome TaxID=1070528 RepID=A0A6M3IL39_9ZZZZ
MKIPLGTGHYTGRSSNLNALILQNMYAQLDRSGKSIVSLFNTPGLTLKGTPEADVEVRGLYPLGDYLYAACGSNFYQITTGFVATDKGNLNTAAGFVDFCDDGTYVILSDGTDGYTYNVGTDTFAQIVDVDFIGAKSMTYQDGYAITAEVDSQDMMQSAAADPTAYTSTHKTSVNRASDNLVRAVSSGGNLWAFGDLTAEVYHNTGAALFSFERYEVFLQHGLLARGAFTEADNTRFWLNQNRWLLRDEAYRPIKLNIDGIDYQFESYTTVNDAILYSFEMEGHIFVNVTFPTADETRVYDVSTGQWFKWASYRSSDTGYGRHRSNCYAYFNGEHIVGDFENGKLYELDLDVFTDNSEGIQRRFTLPNIYDKKSRNCQVHHRFEIDFEGGVGLATGQGSDPQAMLDWSNDDGHTWSNERWADIGKIGEYGNRAIWDMLGMAENRIYRCTISDPVKVVVLGAYGEIETLRHKCL